jgi:hypothetical protein
MADFIAAREYLRGEIFRLPISLDQPLISGDQIYAELEGPDGSSECILKSESSIKLPGGNDHLIDGHVSTDAPFGFYRVTKLEIHGKLGGPKLIPLEIPFGEHGIRVVQSKPQHSPPMPKVTSLG